MQITLTVNDFIYTNKKDMAPHSFLNQRNRHLFIYTSFIIIVDSTKKLNFSLCEIQAITLINVVFAYLY